MFRLINIRKLINLNGKMWKELLFPVCTEVIEIWIKYVWMFLLKYSQKPNKST